VKGEQVAVDARPSDAIALALRSRSPILVDEPVIEAAKAGRLALAGVENDRLASGADISIRARRANRSRPHAHARSRRSEADQARGARAHNRRAAINVVDL
jgi:hypothetical protein